MGWICVQNPVEQPPPDNVKKLQKQKSNYELFVGRYSSSRESSNYDIKLYPPKPSDPGDDDITPESKLYFIFSKSEVINMENGLEQLFGTIQWSLETADSFLVFYIFNTQNFTEISKHEFKKWLLKYNVQSASKLSTTIQREINELWEDQKEITKFFQYVFRTGQNTESNVWEIELATAVLQIMMGPSTPYQVNPLVPKFVDYIAKNNKWVTRDEFVSASEFFLKYKSQEQEYDEMESWPVLMDNFWESLKD